MKNKAYKKQTNSHQKRSCAISPKCLICPAQYPAWSGHFILSVKNYLGNKSLII